MKRLSNIIFLFAIGLLATWGFSLFVPDAATVVAQSPRPTQTQNQKPTQTQNQNPTQNQNAQLNAIDRIFIIEAAQAGIGNIELGQLALKNSNNAEVKAFANAEIQEQTQLKNDLTKIAPQLGVQLPTTPSPKFQAAMTKLSQLDGEQFNTAYMDEGGINAHLENAALFQREAAFGQNQELVSLANRGLPIIRQHFTIATRATNYEFAQVPRQYNNFTTNVVPRGNTAPTNPTNSR